MPFLKLYQKSIASFVVVAFLFSFFTFPPEALAAPPAPSVYSFQDEIRPSGIELPLSSLPLGVPPELASIKEAFLPASPKNPQAQPLIHIQSVHAHAETQKKIYALLKFLDEKYGIESLFIEGAGEALNPAYFRFFDDNQINVRVAEKLVEKGELTGAELFLIENQKQIPAYGLEDPKLYRDNLASFQSVMLQRRVTSEFTQEVREVLDRLETLLLTPNARKLLRTSESFDAGQMELLSYALDLGRKTQQVLGLDLRNFENQLDWPQMIRLLRLQEIESKLQPEGVRSDKQKLLTYLTEIGADPDLIRGFENLSFSPFQSGMVYDPGFRRNDLPRYLAERLVIAARGKGFSFEQYPHFTRFLEAAILQSELEAERLFLELERLFETLVRSVSRQEVEWKMVETVHEERLLERLFDLELTPKDYLKVQSVSQGERPLVRFLLGIESLHESSRRGSKSMVPANIEVLESIYGKATRFYELAKEREETMAKRILEWLPSTPSSISSPPHLSPSPPKGERDGVRGGVSILITGGFHTEGLSRAFRKNEVPYTILSPRITEPGSPEAYISSLLGETKTAFDTAYLEPDLDTQDLATLEKMWAPAIREKMLTNEVRVVVEGLTEVVNLPVFEFLKLRNADYFRNRRTDLRLNDMGNIVVEVEGKPLKNLRGIPFAVGTRRIREKQVEVREFESAAPIAVPAETVKEEGKISGSSGASSALQTNRRQRGPRRLSEPLQGSELPFPSSKDLPSLGVRIANPPQSIAQTPSPEQSGPRREMLQRTPMPNDHPRGLSQSPSESVQPPLAEKAQTWRLPFMVDSIRGYSEIVNNLFNKRKTPSTTPRGEVLGVSRSEARAEKKETGGWPAILVAAGGTIFLAGLISLIAYDLSHRESVPEKPQEGEVGEVSRPEKPILEEVALTKVAEWYPLPEDFETFQLQEKLLARLKENGIAPEQVKKLMPDLTPSSPYSFAFNGQIVFVKMGNQVVVGITGEKTEWQAPQRSVTSKIPYGKILYRPAIAASFIEYETGALKQTGFTQDGRLVIAPTRGSISILGSDGKIKAYARAVKSRPEARSEEPKKVGVLSLAVSDRADSIVKAAEFDLSIHQSPVIVFYVGATPLSEYKGGRYVGDSGLLVSNDGRPISETVGTKATFGTELRKIMGQAQEGTRFQLLRENYVGGEPQQLIPTYVLIVLNDKDSPVESSGRGEVRNVYETTITTPRGQPYRIVVQELPVEDRGGKISIYAAMPAGPEETLHQTFVLDPAQDDMAIIIQERTEKGPEPRRYSFTQPEKNTGEQNIYIYFGSDLIRYKALLQAAAENSDVPSEEARQFLRDMSNWIQRIFEEGLRGQQEVRNLNPEELHRMFSKSLDAKALRPILEELHRKAKTEDMRVGEFDEVVRILREKSRDPFSQITLTSRKTTVKENLETVIESWRERLLQKRLAVLAPSDADGATRRTLSLLLSHQVAFETVDTNHFVNVRENIAERHWSYGGFANESLFDTLNAMVFQVSDLNGSLLVAYQPKRNESEKIIVDKDMLLKTRAKDYIKNGRDEEVVFLSLVATRVEVPFSNRQGFELSTFFIPRSKFEAIKPALEAYPLLVVQAIKELFPAYIGDFLNHSGMGFVSELDFPKHFPAVFMEGPPNPIRVSLKGINQTLDPLEIQDDATARKIRADWNEFKKTLPPSIYRREVRQNPLERNAGIIGKGVLDLGKVAELTEKNSRILYGSTLVVPLNGSAVGKLAAEWDGQVRELTDGKFSLITAFPHATVSALIRSQSEPIEMPDLAGVNFDEALRALAQTQPFDIEFNRLELTPDGELRLMGRVAAETLEGLQGSLRTNARFDLKDKPGTIYVVLGHLNTKVLKKLKASEAKALQQWMDETNAGLGGDQMQSLRVEHIAVVNYYHRLLGRRIAGTVKGVTEPIVLHLGKEQQLTSPLDQLILKEWDALREVLKYGIAMDYYGQQVFLAKAKEYPRLTSVVIFGKEMEDLDTESAPGRIVEELKKRNDPFGGPNFRYQIITEKDGSGVVTVDESFAGIKKRVIEALKDKIARTEGDRLSWGWLDEVLKGKGAVKRFEFKGAPYLVTIKQETTVEKMPAVDQVPAEERRDTVYWVTLYKDSPEGPRIIFKVGPDDQNFVMEGEDPDIRGIFEGKADQDFVPFLTAFIQTIPRAEMRERKGDAAKDMAFVEAFGKLDLAKIEDVQVVHTFRSNVGAFYADDPRRWPVLLAPKIHSKAFKDAIRELVSGIRERGDEEDTSDHVAMALFAIDIERDGRKLREYLTDLFSKDPNTGKLRNPSFVRFYRLFLTEGYFIFFDPVEKTLSLSNKFENLKIDRAHNDVRAFTKAGLLERGLHVSYLLFHAEDGFAEIILRLLDEAAGHSLIVDLNSLKRDIRNADKLARGEVRATMPGEPKPEEQIVAILDAFNRLQGFFTAPTHDAARRLLAEEMKFSQARNALGTGDTEKAWGLTQSVSAELVAIVAEATDKPETQLGLREGVKDDFLTALQILTARVSFWDDTVSPERWQNRIGISHLLDHVIRNGLTPIVGYLQLIQPLAGRKRGNQTMLAAMENGLEKLVGLQNQFASSQTIFFRSTINPEGIYTPDTPNFGEEYKDLPDDKQKERRVDREKLARHADFRGIHDFLEEANRGFQTDFEALKRAVDQEDLEAIRRLLGQIERRSKQVEQFTIDYSNEARQHTVAPSVPQTPPVAPSTSQPTPSAAPQPAAQPFKHGLVVDDEEGVRMINRFAISENVKRIDVAENGRRAFEMIEAAENAGEPIDLVVSDINMPELDGVSLAQKVEDSNLLKFKPIFILVTGMGGQRQSDIDKLLAAKRVVKVLTKPYKPADLLNAVAEAGKMQRGEVRSVDTLKRELLPGRGLLPELAARTEVKMTAPDGTLIQTGVIPTAAVAVTVNPSFPVPAPLLSRIPIILGKDRDMEALFDVSMAMRQLIDAAVLEGDRQIADWILEVLKERARQSVTLETKITRAAQSVQQRAFPEMAKKSGLSGTHLAILDSFPTRAELFGMVLPLIQNKEVALQMVFTPTTNSDRRASAKFEKDLKEIRQFVPANRFMVYHPLDRPGLYKTVGDIASRTSRSFKKYQETHPRATYESFIGNFVLSVPPGLPAEELPLIQGELLKNVKTVLYKTPEDPAKKPAYWVAVSGLATKLSQDALGWEQKNQFFNIEGNRFTVRNDAIEGRITQIARELEAYSEIFASA